MRTQFYSLFTRICHFGYKSVRFTYEIYKKIKSRFKGYDLNPYRYISLYPMDLKIDIINKNYKKDSSFPKYTTITPVLNEEKNITDVLKSIESQTLLPDQVIIIDAASTDKTIEKINQYKTTSKLNIEIITSKIRNIGYQRNLGIQHSRNDLIVNVDAGTFLSENYGLNIIGPFVENKNLDLVSGVHEPTTKHPWSIHFTPEEHFKRRQEPYGACIAYKKSIALKAGGYPEYISYAGEDTFFCYKYKKLSKHWVFNIAASIEWEHPDTFKKAQAKVMHYMLGNFEIGLWPYFHNGTRFGLPLWIGYFFKPFRSNYPLLLQKQANVEIKKRHIKGLRFIISKDRITDDTKLQNIATNLVEDNYKVFFIDFATLPPTNSKPVFINIDHSLLELIHHTNFNIEDFKKRYGGFIENSVFIIEYSETGIMSQITKTQKEFDKIKIEYL